MWIGTNAYTWWQICDRQGKKLEEGWPWVLDTVAAAGLSGVEITGESPEQVARLAKLHEERGLSLRSMYVNARLHEADAAKASSATILELAPVAREVGISIFACNPEPIQWGSPDNKSDEQLRFQNEQLEAIGLALSEQGISLAYHFHDPEFRAGAREVYAALSQTSPEALKLCFDTHWAYRGSGNSVVGLENLITLFGQRVVSLHLRQSKDGVWSEGFGPGDLDYPRLLKLLLDKAPDALPVLEIAWEEGTPAARDPQETHQDAIAYLKEIWPR